TRGGDKNLVVALRQELKLRDAWPQPPNPWLPLAAKPHGVLITERDTLYCQAFRNTFETAIDRDTKSNPGDSTKRLHHFTYLRGADGQYPLSDKREEQPQRTAASTGDQSGPDTGTELPHGSSQFDYIRRLAKEISD